MEAIFFVNYSEVSKIRTTETKLCSSLKECEDFSKGKSGYIIRQDSKNHFEKFFGEFEPSATEEQKIKNILK